MFLHTIRGSLFRQPMKYQILTGVSVVVGRGIPMSYCTAYIAEDPDFVFNLSDPEYVIKTCVSAVKFKYFLSIGI